MHATGKPQNMQECASTNLYNDTVCIKKNRSWCMYNKTCNVSSFFKQVLRLFFCKYGHLNTNSIYGDLSSLKVSSANGILVFFSKKTYLKNLRYLGWF